MAEARRTFAPVVLLGLAAAVLSAVAGARPWLRIESVASRSEAVASTLEADGGEAPLAAALALVLLACWGVVLVTRGRVRRLVTWSALASALGVLATAVTSRFTLPDQFRDALERLGVTGVALTWTGWYWAAVVGAVLSVVASGLGARLVGTWPEMGSRYDAPAAREARPTADDADESQALWKAIDEGRDPTG